MHPTILKLIQERQSVRRYSNKPVEREKIERCLEAARLSPSACNSQPWKFIVVDDSELKEKVAKETYNTIVSFNKFAKQAPVIIVIVIEKANLTAQFGSKIKNIEYPLIDIGIAAEHFCLQATDEGLGSCMIGWFNEKKIKKLLEIPGTKSVGLLISLGYEEDNYKQRKKIRKEMEVMSSYNRY